MIDLTPLEVRKKKGDFKRAMRGYDPGLVDDFLELVADRLEELVRANLSHEDRVRQLEQQLRDYKERERALTDALVSAQELREEMREQAVRDAEMARREAEQEAEQIRANVAQEIEREEQTLRRLRARQAQLAQSYRALLERELEELEVIAGGITYRAGLDDEVEAPRREPQAVREPRPAYAAEPPREAPVAAVAAPAVAEPVAEPSAHRVNAPAPAVNEPAAEPTAHRVPQPAAEPTAHRVPAPAPAVDEHVEQPRSHRAPPAVRIDENDEEEEVDDEALERSLEALQVVFARDEAEARRDWPLSGSAHAARSRAATSFAESSEDEPLAEPTADDAAADAALQAGQVPVAFEEDSFNGDELLLEDAIDEEGEAEEEEPRAAAAVEPWLPKLIEDAP
ncbi:MAG TPA: DivIVA domain-containing protein [Longimicrobiales bacterium]|nr:DivIVA domain-containing protein [Longimicrobiales bacterium]